MKPHIKLLYSQEFHVSYWNVTNYKEWYGCNDYWFVMADEYVDWLNEVWRDI